MQVDREKFGKAVLQTIYDLEILGIEPTSALPGILAEVDELIRLNAPETLANRCDHFQIPQTAADDYKERFFEVKPGGYVLAGIRHLSGLKEEPFVHVLSDFTPTAKDLSAIKQFALENFQAFSPKQVSIWLRPSCPLASILEESGFAARRYVAGKLASISQHPLPAGYERISLDKLESGPKGDWYEKAYAEFHSEHPGLERRVPITDKEELRRCANEDLLFRVLVDGKHAGLVGGQKEPLLGCAAVYMTEFLLMRPYNGQGLASALQRKFLDALATEFKLVWGTIDAKNKASYQTALNIGRAPIRSEFFLPLGSE